MKKIILAIILFIMIGCKSQTKNTNKMEKFDKKDYENFIIDNEYSISSTDSYYKNGNIKIKIQYFKETIQVENNSTDDNYKYFKTYRIDDKSLKIIGQDFYDFPISVWSYYDEKGNLIKEVNYEVDYKFSIQELAKKMKEDYSIDILKKSRWVKVMRENIDSLAVYIVMVYVKENKYSDTKNYIIDGTTGKVISEKIISYPKE